MAEIQISRSRTGLPVIGVGGGAYSNTFTAKTVIRRQSPAPAGDQPTGLKYSLVKPIFVKSSGHLCCDHEQAIVPIRQGDIIVQMSGSLPADDNNPDAQITGQLIREIGNGTATTEPYPLTFEDVPVLVIRGAEIWHNRNGAFFCDADAGEY